MMNLELVEGFSTAGAGFAGWQRFSFAGDRQEKSRKSRSPASRFVKVRRTIPAASYVQIRAKGIDAGFCHGFAS
jgi:hypothetical protein